MDNRINDDMQSDIGESNEKTIVDGLFGVSNEENNDENNAVSSGVESETKMEVEDDTTINLDKLLRKNENTQLSDDKNCCITLEEESTFDEKNEKFDDCLATNSISFGSHVLCLNPDPSKSEIPSSFALISENYEKSRKDDVLTETVLSSEDLQSHDHVSESNTESVVVLSKGNLPSTLSLISTNYQDSSSSDDDNNSSCTEISHAIVIDSDDENSIIAPIRTRGELDISELPPIEELKISVEEDKCQPVGNIKSIVQTLVVVEAFLNQPALDIDSVLFVDRGQRALGRIFDVFGPVNKPYYAVRFNDSEHIKKFDIHIKEPVYCAPQTEYASFVLVSQLLKMKGSDASWKHNNEPPCEYLDYSDDEAEKLAKKIRKQKKCADSEVNDVAKKGKSPDPPAQNVTKKIPKATINYTPNSTAQNSNRPPSVYSPRPPNSMYSPRPPNYNYSPRQFPTYAQYLSSMEYNQNYRQPYNPHHFDHAYPPRHSFPFHPYRPPGYEYQSQQLRDPNNPNQFQYPNYDYNM